MIQVFFLEELKAIKHEASSPVAVFTILFCMVQLALTLGGVQVAEALQYDRDQIASGEVWRLLTGHFVHFGMYHTVINLLCVALIGLFLFSRQALWLWIVAVFFVPFVDSLGLYYFSADTYVYRGYSGVVYGLAVAGVVMNLHRSPVLYAVILVALLAKVVYQQLPVFNVDYLMDEIGVAVSADAHLWGVVAGGLYLVLYYGLPLHRAVEEGEEPSS